MDALLQSRAQQLATEFASQATTVEELNELMRLMMKSGLERMLDTEMDVHLGRRPLPPAADVTVCVPQAGEEKKKRSPNRRNGRSRKTVQGDLGEVTLSTPRDRDGTFEPQLIEKHQRRVPGFDEKILALYAKGMTVRDIQEIVRELYGVEVSATLISAITEDLDAEVTAWRTRPLSPVWPIVYFDGIVVHVRGANGRVSQHTIYVALGVDLAGQKELLGLYLSEHPMGEVAEQAGQPADFIGAGIAFDCALELLARLREAGTEVVVGVLRLQANDGEGVDGSTPTGVAEWLDRVAEAGPLSGVACWWAGDADTGSPASLATGLAIAGLHVVQAVQRRAQAQAKPPHLVWVTPGAVSDRPAPALVTSPLGGLLRVAQAEHRDGEAADSAAIHLRDAHAV